MTIRRLLAVCFMIVWAATAWAGGKPLSKAEFAAQFPTPEIPPQVSLSMPDAPDGRVALGKKIGFRVTLSHPSQEASAKPIELVVPENVDWRNLIRLTVYDKTHKELPWKLTPSPSEVSARVAIAPGKPVPVDYGVDESILSSITPGDYSAIAKVAAGVYGKRVMADPVSFAIVDPAAVRQEKAPAPQPAQAASTASGNLGALPATPPKVTVYVNDSKNLEHFKGWPMIVRVGVEPAASSAGEPFTLSVSEGDWSKLINVEARDTDGVLQDWQFEPATLAEPAEQIQIDKNNPGIATFVVSGKTTSAANPGEYRLRAVLAMGASGKLVRGEPALVQLAEHPESLDDAMLSRREKLMAVYHALRGEKEEALHSAENARAIALPQPVGAPVMPQAPMSSPQAGLSDILSQFGAGSFIPNFQGESVDPSDILSEVTSVAEADLPEPDESPIDESE